MSNRRDWIRTTLALATGLPVGAALSERLMASPMSEAEKKFYSSGKRPVYKIRLASNENPYGPSDAARKAMAAIINETNRYPFQAAAELKKVLAAKEGVTPDHIAVGAGSGDLLCATGAAFAVEGGRILSGFPTFPMLMGYAEVFRATWDKVNMNDALEYDYQAVAAQIKNDTRLVFVCNPNNPTGTLVNPATVRSFCEDVSKRVPVFSDEAYLEFLDPSMQTSMLSLVKQDANVIVSRTFSKIYGLGGLRIGYIVARPDLIKKISKTHPGIPTNQVGIAAATACINDAAFMDMSRRKNAEARKHLTDYLERKGYFFGKSHTNFVMFDPKADAGQIISRLAERGIAIRAWDYNGKQWLRVSIGTADEMKTFVKEFEEVG